MATNVSQPSGTWAWTPANLSALTVYVDGDNLPSLDTYVSTWSALYGSGSFGQTGYSGRPYRVNIGAIPSAQFTASGSDMLTGQTGDNSAQGFSAGVLCYSDTAQDWKDAISLTYGFDPASSEVARIETGGGSTTMYSGVGVTTPGVSGTLNTSSWIFASMRGGGSTGGTSLHRNGVFSMAANYSSTTIWNRCILGANYLYSRHMQVAITAAWCATTDIGVENIMKLEGWIARKYSLTGNLSTSHWNKTIPPFTKRILFSSEAFSSVA